MSENMRLGPMCMGMHSTHKKAWNLMVGLVELGTYILFIGHFGKKEKITNCKSLMSRFEVTNKVQGYFDLCWSILM